LYHENHRRDIVKYLMFVKRYLLSRRKMIIIGDLRCHENKNCVYQN